MILLGFVYFRYQLLFSIFYLKLHISNRCRYPVICKGDSYGICAIKDVERTPKYSNTDALAIIPTKNTNAPALLLIMLLSYYYNLRSDHLRKLCSYNFIFLFVLTKVWIYFISIFDFCATLVFVIGMCNFLENPVWLSYHIFYAWKA